MNQFYIGCSGFHYRDWKDIFYPEKLPQTKWFEFYCRHFNTLEINSSFYKFPTEKSLVKWYETSPPDFKFSLKVPRLITHYKKFSECTSSIKDFYTLVENGLKEKLGCVLFQLPPQFLYSPSNLQIILSDINQSFQNVFEFRHISWWNEEVFLTFKEKGLIFSGVSFPKLPDGVIQTSAKVYYRFHGVPVLYKSLYEEAFIREIYSQLISTDAKESWIYFNNTWGTAAIENARFLLKMAQSKQSGAKS